MSGKLFVVSTPIGNLQDISKRAIDILKYVDIIIAEDTRITIRLLREYDIKNEIMSFHINNEKYKIDKIISLLKSGKNMALVSDAGTPCISDPGYLLTNQLRKQGMEIISIPGASAPIAALSVSGLPSEKFFFEGFLPKKKGRQKALKKLSELDSTVVIFESPHRLLKTLEDLLNFMGNRYISICKEISKINESNFFGKIDEIISEFKIFSKIKGEYVIVIAKDDYEIR